MERFRIDPSAPFEARAVHLQRAFQALVAHSCSVAAHFRRRSILSDYSAGGLVNRVLIQ